jgi:pilus assembly protein CpaB
MRRPIIFVLLAGFAALVAALVVYSALRKREAEVEKAMVKSVEIVVAARDLSIGTKLDPSAVKLIRWSREDIPPGAFTDPAAVMNQYIKSGFVQGEPVVADRLFSGDKNAGVLPLLIPSGMRAVSVPVDEVSDIAGFVLPHARVDILVAVSSGGNADKPFSKIVLQNVEVLAVAQEIENINADKPEVVKVVTLLVTPEEAERLTLASREGSLRLAMRNYEDKKIVMTNGVDVQQMLRAYGGPQQTLPVMAPQHVPVARAHGPRVRPVEVEILRNGKSSENVSFIRSDGSMQPASPNSMQPAPPKESSSSSAADSPDKVAAATTDGPAALGNSAKRLAADAPVAGVIPDASMAPAKSASSGLALGAMSTSRPVLASPGGEGFNAPTSKTIEVP